MDEKVLSWQKKLKFLAPVTVKNLGLFLIFALALGLRTYNLSNESYWVDEMVSIHFATHSDWRAIFWDNTPFLYHLILKFWAFGFGTSENATRSLSILFSMLSSVMIYRFVALNFSVRAGLISLLLFSLSGFSIRYAQETRTYSLFELMTIINLASYFFLLESPKVTAAKYRTWLICGLFLVASHYIGLWLLFIQVLLFFALKTKGIQAKVIALGFLFLSLVGLLLVKPYFSHLSWQSKKFSTEAISRVPVELFSNLFNFSTALFVFGLLLGCIYIYLFKRNHQKQNEVKGGGDHESRTKLLFESETKLLFQDRGDHQSETKLPFESETKWLTEGFKLKILLGFFLVSITYWTIASLILNQVLLAPRYHIYLNPIFIILSSFLICEFLRFRKAVGIVFLFSWIIFSLLSIPNYYELRKAPWRSASLEIQKYEGSIVLTTKTEAIATPYFEKYGILVKLWDGEFSDLVWLENLRTKYKHIWIVDNEVSSVVYFEDFKNTLDQKKIRAEVFSIERGWAEPIKLIKIQGGH